MKRQVGFSMMEVVTSVALIAVLLAVALPAVKGARERSREEALKSHLALVRSAADAFALDMGCLPGSLAALTSAVVPSSCITHAGGTVPADPKRFKGPYLPYLDPDPVSGATLTYSPTGSGAKITSSATGNDSKGVPYSTY